MKYIGVIKVYMIKLI